MSTTPERHVGGPEEFLGQILLDGRWVDYARGHERESRAWQRRDPENRRIVDWIDKRKIIVAARPAPRAFTVADLPQAATVDEQRDDVAGYYYAWGRLDQGHAPVARQADAERDPSATSTSWLFGAMWMQAQREFRDPEHPRTHSPGIESAWDNFTATGGHSLDRQP